MGAYASLQPLFNQDLSSSSPTTTSPTPTHFSFFFLLHRLSRRSIMPAKKRCQFQINTASQCSSAALRIVGECPHCRAQFCSSHRLPEHHNCSKLEDCRQQAFDRNKNKLESERTVASKMATA
ncbi:hypothetical protein Agabi119p4_3428 [Agaricus bisporus var. burnettii]|uniref:AN1-type domain-containing protein n=2 Tax=Agaricus bisporus var. burnettii TaxID=192524 RepID=A0A8H7F730_AGABI|nr:hypothetical protein Agabi119p4_3428 [Agaricus bisporus var. burnettii]